MARIIEWVMWRVLHLFFALICFLGAAFSRARGFISSSWIHAGDNLVKEIFVVKPLTVAVVFESQETVDKDGKIPQLLFWLSTVNVSHVTIYDAQGRLKRSHGQLQKILNTLETEDQKIHCYSEADSLPQLNGSQYLREESMSNRFISVEKYDKLMQSKGSILGKRKSGSPTSDVDGDKPQSDMAAVSHMKVELLSLQDGKGSLVRAARHVCENAYKMHYAKQSTKGTKLSEEDINKSLQATGGEGPDPDLLLLFGMTRSLLGFPPWRLRLTEIVHMGSLRDLTSQSFASTLKEFAKKTHRYGR